MIGRLALGLVAAAALGAAGTPAPAGPPAERAGPAPPTGAATLADRLGWNAFERTREGLRRLGSGQADAAAEALDTAARLRPEDSRAAYNAGTGRLDAGRPDAREPLEQAARTASAELAPDAWYNLGNARLAADDARGAVDAYAESLRRAPARLDAKHNLELALRELDRQRQQQQRQQQQRQQQEQKEKNEERGERQDEPRDSPAGDAAKKADDSAGQDASRPDPSEQGQARPDAERSGDPQETGARRPGAEEPPRPSAGAGKPGSPPPQPGSTLPGFEDQPDLDAAQAAALLRAVENLERQQRRERALERARARRQGDEDW